jgi:hypothetical protein
MNYVPFVIRDDVNERAWKRAKEQMAREPGVGPAAVTALQRLERVKQLILSGDPAGELS